VVDKADHSFYPSETFQSYYREPLTIAVVCPERRYMDLSLTKRDFLKDDLYNSLKELFLGAVTWHAHPEGKGARYLRDLGMFTCFVQARALYEFFYHKVEQTKPGGTACSQHFASPWRPCDLQNLYSKYMGKNAPAQKRVFHLVYGRSCFSGGSKQDGADDLKNQVLSFAQDLKRLAEEFATACNQKDHRELAEGALARALHDGHELAKSYEIPGDSSIMKLLSIQASR
jgi:hypothetical protein